MKIKFEIELDTERPEDEQKIEELIKILQELREQLEN